MIIELGRHEVVVTAEPGDKMRYYNGGWGSAESQLLHHIKKAIIAQYGHDVIKKDPQKDGHMIGNEHYLRTRKGYEPSFQIWDGNYALRLLHEDWFENGKVTLGIQWDIWKED